MEHLLSFLDLLIARAASGELGKLLQARQLLKANPPRFDEAKNCLSHVPQLVSWIEEIAQARVTFTCQIVGHAAELQASVEDMEQAMREAFGDPTLRVLGVLMCCDGKDCGRRFTTARELTPVTCEGCQKPLDLCRTCHENIETLCQYCGAKHCHLMK